MAKVWTEIIRDIADAEMIPYSVTDLAADMVISWNSLRAEIQADTYNFSSEVILGKFFICGTLASV